MHQEEYCKKNECCSIDDVIDRGLWLEMVKYISKYFPEYEEVIRCKKIILDSWKYYKEYGLDEYTENKVLYNAIMIDTLTEYFKKKTADVDKADE